MKYGEILVRAVKNPDGYLGFDEPSTLSYQDGIADDSYSKGTTEGYLAAAIIYHQLTEKILLMLITYSDLYVQAKIYPEKIDTFYQDLDSFGQLMKRHKTTVGFSKKSKILKNANELNKYRVQLVHKMDELKHEDNIDIISKKIRDNFEAIFRDWKDAMKWFYKQLDLLKSQTKWKKLFEKYSLR